MQWHPAFCDKIRKRNPLLTKGFGFFLRKNKEAVSRRHAVIERINGTYYLMDKSSTNHTYLNGEMLDAENSYVLSDHDSIQIADEEFTFYFD